MASNQVDDSDQSTTPPSMAIVVQPSVPQLYPRIHLLGLPQELQDLIMDEAFNLDDHDYGELCGARFLQPLLTCRHIYHIANEKAWSGCDFDLDHFRPENKAQLAARIPASVASREVCILWASRESIRCLVELRHLLPGAASIVIDKVNTDPEAGGGIKEWTLALLRATDLYENADRVSFHRTFFPQIMIKVIERCNNGLNAILAARARAGQVPSDATYSKLKHVKNGEQEFFEVELYRSGKSSRKFQLFLD